ncbi:MAG: N-acetyltransferase family protein [Rickettsiaceae bacterium]|nr:MAG: N-acetyltransferase family protein [Rickettsiaceae bacterium]
MISIRTLQPADWPEVKQIYLEGIATGQATFQTEAPSWEDWDKSHLPLRYVALFGGNEIAGWAALSPVSSRCVYAGVAEVSVYIGEHFREQRLGFALLEHMIAESEKANIWTLQSGIFPENVASVKLHEKLGFRVIGHREKVAKQNGVWRDVYLLERRSNIVGID